jgi:hypothetical protein
MYVRDSRNIKKFVDYYKNDKNISGDDNRKLVKYVDENMMFDFKDNDIEYSIYGHYDFNYGSYQGLVVQIFRHSNSDSELGACFNGKENCVIYDDACPLYPYILKLHQKVNTLIKTELHVESDTTVVTITFSFLDGKINI